MLIVDTWDVLVVGAGPAGSTAAAASAREGARTLLIDAKDRIGEQPHCGEFVPRRLFAEFGLNRASIVQAVDSMVTCVLDHGRVDRSGTVPVKIQDDCQLADAGSGEPSFSLSESAARAIETVSPGFLIDRVRFDRDLARVAAAMGATVLSSTRLLSRTNGRWIIRYGGREIPIRAGFLIAADGALSTVARILGFEPPELVRGVQVEAPLTRSLDRTFVFLERGIRAGYGWLFPKGLVANIGIGVAQGDGIHPNEILEGFLRRLINHGMIKPGRLARSGGVIPVSGLRERLVRDNVILCGDAAGLTHPVTGAGIPQAVLSGALAGRASAQAARTGNVQSLIDYESEIRAHYGGALGHALAKRRLMTRLWDHQDFSSTCEQTWIAFKGYSRRVRSC